ncbi:MAG TPA: hypothetical protein VGY77_00025, partial [Gemmataceae bacterium]|nr:hypothetical protein [Gemmataceae bacterium]
PTGAPGASGSGGNGRMLGTDLAHSLDRNPLSTIENQAAIANIQNPSLSGQGVDLLFTHSQRNERPDSATRDRVFANLSPAEIQNGNSFLEMDLLQLMSVRY